MTNKKSEKKFEITEEQVKKLMEVLSKFDVNIKVTNTKTAFDGIIDALNTIADQREKEFHPEGHPESKEEDLRKLQDDNDSQWQRLRKGNFILNSPDMPVRNLKTVFLTDKELEAANPNVADKDSLILKHAQEHILTYYGVDVPDQDVQACHRIPGNGSILLKFSNRRNNSAYSKLVKAVKTGGKAGLAKKNAKSPAERNAVEVPNFFICFHLTKRRGLLVKHLKQLRKAKTINNFSTDQNGAIAIQIVREGDWIAVSRKCNGDNDDQKTLYPAEIDELVKNKSKNNQQ